MSARTYKKESVLSILACCSLLPQDFGQLLVQIILYFIKKNVRVYFGIACSMVIIMLWNRRRQGGVLKHMGNAQILLFLAVRVLSSVSFWAVKERLIRHAWNDKNGACCCVCNKEWGVRVFNRSAIDSITQNEELKIDYDYVMMMRNTIIN